MKEIFSRIRLNTRHLVWLLVLTLASALGEMLLPTLFSRMIDQGVTYSSTAVLLQTALIMAIVAVIGCVAGLSLTRLSAKITTSFGRDLRQQVFDKVQSLSASQADSFGTPSLITRTTSDVTNVQMFLNMMLRLGVTAPLMAVSGLVLSALSGGGLSTVLYIAVPALLIGAGIIVFLASRLSVKMRKGLDTVNRLFLENLEGVRVIRAFSQEEYEIRKFAAVNENVTRTSIHSARITGLLMPVIQIIFGLTTVTVLALGTYYVWQGQLEVGALVANVQYISMILASIMILAAVLMMMPTTLACAGRIAQVLQTTPDVQDGKGVELNPEEKLTISFEKVSFLYPNAEEPVLSDLSFQAKSGTTTAILGRTGSGKSTLVQLLPRLYDPTLGHITINGHDLKDFTQKQLRDLIGYVPQKNILLSGDAARNLNVGDLNGSEADWIRAADTACALEFIEQKEGGFHMPVAQGGANLSGGQRQRMAIARALMKKPKILLFDDSFSALDMKTDRTLRSNLKRDHQDALSIIVAQRISSVMDAEQIIVLDEGKIVGKGTHKELLRTCPLYYSMAELQLPKEVLEHDLEEE